MPSRYQRHLDLSNWTSAGQQRLEQARLLYIGTGGLGCATLPLLAGAGLGHITVMDGDKVEEHNLPRQLVYTEQDIGRNKAAAMQDYLKARNRHIDINGITEFFGEHTTTENYDLIAVGTDTIESRYLANAYVLKHNKPLIIASVSNMQGYVFEQYGKACYQCWNPMDTKPVIKNNAAVLNAMVAVVGAHQAKAVLKYFVVDEQQSSMLTSITFDKIHTMRVQQDISCIACAGL